MPSIKSWIAPVGPAVMENETLQLGQFFEFFTTRRTRYVRETRETTTLQPDHGSTSSMNAAKAVCRQTLKGDREGISMLIASFCLAEGPAFLAARCTHFLSKLDATEDRRHTLSDRQ